ncbi:MAG: Unknown protein [uncultured Thiotrichaceae bacterium]|uniref:Type II toxin-antitoxin system antitoxin, RelB/DinJ family n=1 Tax=uncultured Thiotrichaceae bacterium TaxID=298394 RepID=A0A6S6UCR0_9GAMM|nr:MAG: Unknown protein [uncultured Thiotrichaceae bacterium]
MSNTTRVEPELKGNAERILNQLGMNTTQAINIFLKQVELHKGLPFDVQLPLSSEATPQRQSGLHQGVMSMSDDFDEPLDNEFWLGKT